ncbi:MAG: trigger factor [Rickettsiales bacterium]|jgi:trigger factor|nr:trigger factor [Rickettsiales bacterium]
MIKKDRIRDLHCSVSGVIPGADIKAKSDEILAKYGEKANIAGFRPGHVPAFVLRQKYGPAADEDAINDLINADLNALIYDKKIQPAGAPKADLKKYADGSDAEYELEFDILPELPRIDFERIVLSKKAADVSGADVDSAIENIRANRADFQKQDAGYKLVSGDIAIIDFTGFAGGVKFDGGEGKNHSLKLGSGQFIPGFEEQIVGHASGDEFEIAVKFPEKYHSPELAGKDATFKVKVTEARRSMPPPLDENFAKECGFESVEKMKADVKEILQRQNEDAAKADLRNQLLDALYDKVRLPLPESLVARETEASENKDKKEAERRVKLGLILAQWGNRSEIKVGRDELQGAIWAEAARYPDPKEVYDFYNKNQDALSTLNGMLFERKVLDAMIEKCTVK